jgi:hypothetical protein
MFPSRAAGLHSSDSQRVLFVQLLFLKSFRKFLLIFRGMAMWPRSRILAIMDSTLMKCALVTCRYGPEANGMEVLEMRSKEQQYP